ncbi:MAG: hypothetical protein RLZZ383_465 [Pseudomonadota bacterium]|jgi:hypothetical protein
MARPIGEKGKTPDPWAVLSERERDPELARIREIVEGPAAAAKPAPAVSVVVPVDPEAARDRRVRILAVVLAAGLGVAVTWAGLLADEDHDGESALAEAARSLVTEEQAAAQPVDGDASCVDQLDLPAGSVTFVADRADGGRLRTRLTLREGRRHHVVCTGLTCAAADVGPSGFPEADVRFLSGFTGGKVATAGGWICVRPRDDVDRQP